MKPKSKANKRQRPTGVALRRLVRRLKRVSEMMRQVGADMDYYGGFGKMGDRGREMIGAARLAKSWIKHMEKTPGHCPNCGNPYYRDKHNGDNKRRKIYEQRIETSVQARRYPAFASCGCKTASNNGKTMDGFEASQLAQGGSGALSASNETHEIKL
jgi:hypothetical protein